MKINTNFFDKNKANKKFFDFNYEYEYVESWDDFMANKKPN